MQVFTGRQYLMIDIANSFGLDKSTWMERILWTQYNLDVLEDKVEDAEDKFLYVKAVKALRDTDQGIATGHMMLLDATASGLQIMAALSGCKKTARHVNLISTGSREDVYTHVTNEMNTDLPADEQVTRDDVKKPLMTHYYNKTKQDTLSEAQQGAFYKDLHESFSGAEDVKYLINNAWNPTAMKHEWTLPDGHVASCKVMKTIAARVEVDELAHTTFTYQFEANCPDSLNTSLAPNIIHSIDGYIAREMTRRAKDQGFECVHIHDAFGFHPNYGNQVRENYREILAEIADSDLLQDILSELYGYVQRITKDSYDLHKDILESEYALS